MSEVAVLTTTFYRSPDELRCRLAHRMVKDAVAATQAVLIVDGSPEASISQSLESLGTVVFKQETKGMGPSRRELFNHAGNLDSYGDHQFTPDILVWTEPEREDLIRHLSDIIAPIERDEADIVIPWRTETSWASYPAFQIDSEHCSNRVYEAVTGRRHDIAFGPMAFSQKVLPIFARCNPQKSYAAYDTYIQQIAAMEAMAQGYRVTSVPVDFIYPPEQKEEEEATRRDAMLHYRWRNAMQFSEMICLAARALNLR